MGRVRDGDARQAELVGRRLASCGFAVDVADERGLNGIVRGPRIKRGGRECVRGQGRTEERTLPGSRNTIVSAANPIYVPVLRIVLLKH